MLLDQLKISSASKRLLYGAAMISDGKLYSVGGQEFQRLARLRVFKTNALQSGMILDATLLVK